MTAIASNAVTVGDETIPANTIVWAAGCSVPLGRSLGVELDRAGRVLVNPDLSVPGHPEIFVIGDMASLQGCAGPAAAGCAQVAMQQGAWAANIVRAIEGKPGRPFRYRDLGNMATIGRNSAVADIRGLRLTGFVAWLAWAVVHILNLIGFRNRVLVGVAVALVVPHLPARGAADHGGNEALSGRSDVHRSRGGAQPAAGGEAARSWVRGLLSQRERAEQRQDPHRHHAAADL